MKLPVFLLLVFSLSCASDPDDAFPHDFNTGQLPQQWELFQMTGGMMPVVMEGEEMEWQESYRLRADFTFVKIRLREGVTLTASGTFEFVSDGAERGVLLQYPETNPLLASCTGDNTEYLALVSDGQTLQGSWWACDGPGLFYRRVN